MSKILYFDNDPSKKKTDKATKSLNKYQIKYTKIIKKQNNNKKQTNKTVPIFFIAIVTKTIWIIQIYHFYPNMKLK